MNAGSETLVPQRYWAWGACILVAAFDLIGKLWPFNL